MTCGAGLLQRDWKFILKAIAQCSEIERAVLFGSRAMGHFKDGSDVDLVVYGTHVTPATLYTLDDLLNQHYALPYQFDVLHFESISNEGLKQHIEKVGREVYRH